MKAQPALKRSFITWVGKFGGVFFFCTLVDLGDQYQSDFLAGICMPSCVRSTSNLRVAAYHLAQPFRVVRCVL